MKPRVYAIEYDFKSGVYYGNINYEKRVEHFTREERDKFIERYKKLSDDFWSENIKTYYADLEEVNMDDIINAV